MKVGLLYGFLPAPVLINIEGDRVILSFPEEPETDRAEAARLSNRAARHAKEGRCAQAVKLWKRALKLQSAMVAGPHCPHPYLNLASVRLQQGCYTEALTHLLDLFSKATADDIRSQRAFDLGQKLFLAVIEKLAN